MFVLSAILLWAVVAIQNERWNNVKRACETDNHRYAEFVVKYDIAIANAPAPQQARAKAARDQTLGLIKTLAPPHVDGKGHSTCNVVADRQVSRWP